MLWAALEVKLAGGDWAETWAGPIAVVIVGIIAALYAHYDHKAQLRDNRKRQARQLGYDREMADRADFRNVLDEVGKDVTAATQALIRAESRVLDLSNHRWALQILAAEMEDDLPPVEIDVESPEWKQAQAEAKVSLRDAMEHLELARSAVFKVGPNLFRLRLRLDDDHAVAASHDAIRVAQTKWLLSLGNGTVPLEPGETENLPGLRVAAQTAQDGFVVACRDWFDANAIPEPEAA